MTWHKWHQARQYDLLQIMRDKVLVLKCTGSYIAGIYKWLLQKVARTKYWYIPAHSSNDLMYLNPTNTGFL